MKVDIPYDLAESVAGALYRLVDHYRKDTGHSSDGIAALNSDADRLETIAEDLEERVASMTADRYSAKDRP